MAAVPVRPSAEIIPFKRVHPLANRLSLGDRIQALEWHKGETAPAGARLVIHERQLDDAPEVGDYIGIYRADECWALWGAARQGASITVWHGPSGSDLGHFTSMRDALAAVSCNFVRRRQAARR